MEVALSDEQALLRDSLRELLEREVTFARVRELEREYRFDDSLWAKLAELGWLGLPFPEDMGGGGGSMLDLAIATEEIARSAAVVPFIEVMGAGLTVARFLDPGVARQQVEAIAKGTTILVPAVLDQSDTYEAFPNENGAAGAFSGTRRFVDYGPVATAYLVRSGHALAIVPNDGASVRVELLHSIARLPIADVHFSGAPLTAATPPPQGWSSYGGDGYLFLRRLMRVLTAVQCLGYAQVAADMATEYVKNRVQFGRPLGSFQAVQHHCANMAILNQGTRFLVYEAAWALDEGGATDEQVDMAKAWASKAAVEVTAIAHQLHGGIGVTEEYDLHFFSRRAKERAVAWGTPDECLASVARSVGEPVDWS